MLPDREFFVPTPTNRPLTAERIAALLAAMARFDGEPWMFSATAHRARMSLAAPHMYPPDPQLQAVFGDDPGDLAEASERMMTIWGLSDRWGSGGAEEARAGLGEQVALMNEMAELAVTMPWATGAPAHEIAALSPMGSITDAELELVEAHADQLRPFFTPRAQEPADQVRADDPEAREWLAANGQEAPLAANRFDAADARAFVEELYAAGAVRVVIASECINDDDYELSLGGPYADGLRVQLPADADQRHALFAIASREAEGEGFDPIHDAGQDTIFLWWD